MRELYAKDFNVKNGGDVTLALKEMLDVAKAEKGEKIIIFEKGEYKLTKANSTKLSLNITNTIGDKEWVSGEEKRTYYTPLYVDGIDDLTIDFGGSVLTIYGKMNNAVIVNSKNVTLQNVEIRTDNPDLHEIKVVSKKGLTVEYEIDKESKYEKRSDGYYFVGEDYELSFKHKPITTWWVGDVKPNTPNKIKRCGHPLLMSTIKEVAPYRIKATYFRPVNYEVGERFYLYDVRRKNVGIFADNCENFTLKNVKQRFNYSLAVVCQHCHNVTIDSVDFSPIGEKLMCSIADFIQICMCSGDVVVKDSNFESAGDDCLNVHGFHFKIKNIKDNKLTVSFKHPQSYGFLAIDKGDEIVYVEPMSLKEVGKAKVLSAKMISEYDIEVTVDNVSQAKVGDVIEDITKCPNLLFENNKLNRIITRGILITTRGKVVVQNNIFNSNSMHGILLSNDASSWYESGRVEDIIIKGNTFNSTEGYDIYIKPENVKHEEYIHKNITIINNVFNSDLTGGIYVKSSDNVFIKNNEIHEQNFRIDSKNSNVVKG